MVTSSLSCLSALRAITWKGGGVEEYECERRRSEEEAVGRGSEEESVRGGCHHLEGLVHIDGLLGARLEVGNVALCLAPGEGALLGDDAAVLVDLVAQHDEGDCASERAERRVSERCESRYERPQHQPAAAEHGA